MRSTLDFICFLVAFVLFLLAAIPAVSSKVNLVAAGLAAFTLPFLISSWP
jgi:hypothetical protein